MTTSGHPTTLKPTDQSLSGELPKDLRWNTAAFLVDYVCFGVAFTFLSISSVLPAFVDELTDSAPLIGLVSTAYSGAWLLPQLIVARLINDKPRKKPYLLTATSGRIALWIIALALYLGLSRHPTAMLTLFFICLGLFAVTDGFASIAWFDIMARAIPLKQRGRMIGVGQFVSGLLGIGVGQLVALILQNRPFPLNYALLFFLAGLILIPSAVALALLREPRPRPRPDDAASTSSWRDLWHVLRGDSAFQRLIASRLMVGMISVATSFYVVHAATQLHLPTAVIGQFIGAQTLASVISSPLLSWISERWGPHYVTRIAALTAMIGPLFAWTTEQVHIPAMCYAYPLVYAALGFLNNAWLAGFSNYLLEIAPEHARPAYIGLGNTLAGILTVAPILGGWLLEATSYAVLFGLTTILVGIGFGLTLTLPPPASALPPAQETEECPEAEPCCLCHCPPNQ